MLSKAGKSRWPRPSYLLLVALALGLTDPLRAQDGVAGIPPVSSEAGQAEARDPDLPRSKTQIRVQSILVTTPVTVLDVSGEFVYDLKEKDFQVFDNGVPQSIERFEFEPRALAVVILVQTSEDVAPLLDHVRPLAPVFKELMLGPSGQAAVITFDDRVRVEQEFTSDSDILESTLKRLSARGEQARLNDALVRAMALLEQRPKAARRVIVVFSDGFDRGSETTKEEVARRASDAEVAIYGLRFNPLQALLLKKPGATPQSPLDTNVTRPLPPNLPPTPSRSENVYGTAIPTAPIIVAGREIIGSTLGSSPLELYAGYTGGVLYTHWSKKSLQDQVAKVAADIHSQYELAYVPSTLDQAGFHQIEVRVNRPGAKVRTRAGYFFPGKRF